MGCCVVLKKADDGLLIPFIHLKLDSVRTSCFKFKPLKGDYRL